ncbi:zinc-binding dehydrogenase [Bacillus marinisedimentorum]|uniref:zinc-binding dehydrogenase n=1 Tax=Bacillus marinisedimentorum TaxID=1821260 RepID=UPI0008727DFF|nr:zinc-binding dehydrogenase [Bacillus marinisedimentorum]
MKAFVHEEHKGINGIKLKEMPEPEPEQGEVKVRLKRAGLNHRDLFVPYRREDGDPPVVLGSDGTGVIASVGEGVENWKAGDEVVINPGIGWKEKSPAPPEGFDILGVPTDGTFAEYTVVPADNIERKPEYLSWDEAGVLPLAALTAYRVLFTRGQVKAGDTVFIPGIGSGVATYLLLFAKAAGARVIVTSRKESKLEKARAIGADLAINSNSDWQKELEGEMIDIVIESVGAATFDRSLAILKKGGTIVTFGASAGDEIKINIRSFFYGQYNLLGSTMGSREEFKEMLAFIEKHKIKPVLDKVFSLEEADKAFSYIDQAEQFGKVGINIEG